MTTLVEVPIGSDSDEILSDRLPPRPRPPYQLAIKMFFGLVFIVVIVYRLANEYYAHATPASSHTKVDANLRGKRPSEIPGNGEENDEFAEVLDDYGTDVDGDLIDAVMGEGGDAHVDEHLDELLEDEADEHDHESEGDYAVGDVSDVDELAQFLEKSDEHVSIESASSHTLDMQTFKHLLAALHTFATSDRDQSGLLSPDEVHGVSKMLSSHFHLDAHQFEKLFLKADANGDGSLGSIEFHNLLSEVWQDTLPPKMELLFKRSDRDQSGYIDGDELEILARELPFKFMVPAEKYQDAFAKADVDSDGKLAPKDYKLLITDLMNRSGVRKMHPAMMHLFKAADKDRDGSLEGAEASFIADKLEDKFGLSPEKYKSVAQSVGADGTLDMNKYNELFAAEMKSSPFAKMCPRIVFFFRHFDVDNDLVLEGSELDTLSTKLENRFGVDAATYREAFAAIDTNSDLKLEPQEFKQLIKHLKSKRGNLHSSPAEKPEVVSTEKRVETFALY